MKNRTTRITSSTFCRRPAVLTAALWSTLVVGLGCSSRVTIGTATGGGDPGTSTTTGGDPGTGGGGTGTGTCSDTGTHTWTDTDLLDVQGCGIVTVNCTPEAGDACVCTTLACQDQVFEVHCAGPQGGVAQCECLLNASSIGTCAQPVSPGCNTCDIYRNCCTAFWPVHVD